MTDLFWFRLLVSVAGVLFVACMVWDQLLCNGMTRLKWAMVLPLVVFYAAHPWVVA
jgi:hypothetical protein